VFDTSPRLRELLDEQGALRTLPFRDRLEAFYAVSLKAGDDPVLLNC
jgi:hypothetical protein